MTTSSTAKPQIDWDDSGAREELIDSRAQDAYGVSGGCWTAAGLDPVVADAAALLARVVGQDLEQADDGVFRIARRVAPDRVISTVDPDARHGHKTAAHGFRRVQRSRRDRPRQRDHHRHHRQRRQRRRRNGRRRARSKNSVDHQPPADPTTDEAPTKTVYGDCAYGTGEMLAELHAAGIDPNVKTPARRPPTGISPRTTSRSTWTTTPSPARTEHRRESTGAPKKAKARFGKNCATCPLRRPLHHLDAWTRRRRRPLRSRPRRQPPHAKPTQPGLPTTDPPAPRSNANSPISCADATAGAKPESEASPR